MTANAVTMDPMDPASSRGKSVVVVVVVVVDDNNPSLSPSLVDDGDVNITASYRRCFENSSPQRFCYFSATLTRVRQSKIVPS